VLGGHDGKSGTGTVPIGLSHPHRTVPHMGANDVDIRLTSGRDIRLRELEQSLVYEGLTDGVPTRAGNAKLVAGIVEAATVDGRPVVLLPPVMTPIAGLGGVGSEEACLLPRTAVCARFESSQPIGPDGDYSELTVVWFQDPWAPPVDGAATAQLQAVDWDAVARDMIW
jgi:hypothetical protein